MSDQPTEHLLDAYFAGRLDELTAEKIRIYLEGTPGKRGVVAGILTAVRGGDIAAMPPAEEALRELRGRIANEAYHNKRLTDNTRSWASAPFGAISRWGSGILGATICAALLTVGLTVISLGRRPSPAPSRLYTTPSGQTARFDLGNKTTVLLAPGSSLRADGDDITLIGEAHFSVTPNANRAVVVRTTNAIIRVLGTKFVVRQYPSERVSQIAVEEGKVAVRSEREVTKQTVLTGRMVAHVNDSTTSVLPNTSVEALTAWTRGVLTFNGNPLSDVVMALSRAYGTPIRITDSVLARKQLVLEVSIQQNSLSQILDVIGMTLNAHAMKDSSGYVVASGRNPRQIPQYRRSPQLEKSYGR